MLSYKFFVKKITLFLVITNSYYCQAEAQYGKTLQPDNNIKSNVGNETIQYKKNSGLAIIDSMAASNNYSKYSKAEKFLLESLYYPESRYELAYLYLKKTHNTREGEALLLSACHDGYKFSCDLLYDSYSGKTNNNIKCKNKNCTKRLFVAKQILTLAMKNKGSNSLIDKDLIQESNIQLGKTYIEMNDTQGIKILENELDADNPQASLPLAQLYVKGEITPKNLVRAYMLYDLSGSSYGPEKEEIAKDMTPKQIQQALEMSWRWQEAHHSYRANYRSSGMGIQWQVHQH